MVGIIKEISMYTFVGNINVSLIVLFTNHQRHIFSVIHRVSDPSRWIKTINNFL